MMILCGPPRRIHRWAAPRFKSLRTGPLISQSRMLLLATLGGASPTPHSALFSNHTRPARVSLRWAQLDRNVCRACRARTQMRSYQRKFSFAKWCSKRLLQGWRRSWLNLIPMERWARMLMAVSTLSALAKLCSRLGHRRRAHLAEWVTSAKLRIRPWCIALETPGGRQARFQLSLRLSSSSCECFNSCETSRTSSIITSRVLSGEITRKNPLIQQIRKILSQDLRVSTWLTMSSASLTIKILKMKSKSSSAIKWISKRLWPMCGTCTLKNWPNAKNCSKN